MRWCDEITGASGKISTAQIAITLPGGRVRTATGLVFPGLLVARGEKC
jgi:hypothetical protein